MNCSQFQDVVHDVARNSPLDSRARREALAHADSCGPCDELLVAAQSLTGGLRSLAASKATLEAPQSVEQNLLREFRQVHAPARPAAVRWLRWSAAGLASVAAAAVLSLIVVKHTGFFGGSAGGGSMSASNTAGATIAGGGTTQVPANVSAAAVEALTVDPADLDPNFAQNYVPLPIALDAAPAEDEAIVRANVSPSTLASYGLRINDAASSDTVVADFVVGEDGIPRAVRLVQ